MVVTDFTELISDAESGQISGRMISFFLQSPEAEIQTQPVWAEGGSPDQTQNLHEHGVQPAVWKEVSTLNCRKHEY